MKTKLTQSLTLIFLILPILAFSQKTQKPDDSTRKAKVEKLKKVRRDLYTQKLSLTATEAEKFFPIFDEYQLKLKGAKKEFRNKWNGRKPEELTEEESKAYLADAIKLRETELSLFRTYSEKLKTAIPAKKIIILPRVNKEVQMELMQQVKGMKGRPPGPPPPGHRQGMPPRGPGRRMR